MSRPYSQRIEPLLTHSGSLGANSSLSASAKCRGFSYLVGSIRPNANLSTGSGLLFQGSVNGSYWATIASGTVSASVTTSCKIELGYPYVRIVASSTGAVSELLADFWLQPL